jgi:spore coat protein U-like protein
VRQVIAALGALAAFAAGIGPANAANCSLSLPAVVNAGDYDPTLVSAATSASFTIAFSCTADATTNLTISAGLGANASGSGFETRAMQAGGADRLNYWLYPPGYVVTPNSSTNVWGDGSGLSRVWGPFDLTGGGTTTGTATIQIPSNQDVAGGSYTDSVVFTMVFL